ncbi:O-antigen ligase family protein [Georgenia sp. EYE_87]|uniref:O-antigen ligase family protein n=1 Tax=Georgenia sp. EYE_87 TaxID=2853448 RepID=UPI0027E2ED4B|nr:O-antigen ligase family protein [Georgenia sp. EYE_87]
MVKAGLLSKFARAYLGWSLLFAILATVEASRDAVIFPGMAPTILRDGEVRAVLLSEHPILLSVYFVVCVPFVWRTVRSPILRWAFCVVLVSGILSTGSRGALVLVAVLAAVNLVSHLRRARQGARMTNVLVLGLSIGVALGIVTLVAGVEPFEGASITSSDPTVASVQYRGVLYAEVAQSLKQMPFGWGVGGLPEGQIIVSSPFGPKDLALTVDSEIVLLAFDFGAAGVAAYLATMLWLVLGRGFRSPVSGAAIVAMSAGLYVAIHAWTGLPTLALFLVGATASAPTVTADRSLASGALSR